jgi:hypothetical protein
MTVLTAGLARHGDGLGAADLVVPWVVLTWNADGEVANSS